MGPSPKRETLPGLMANAVQRVVSVVEQVELARDTFRMRLHCPDIARQILPGQFFMLRATGTTDPLLGRPFALYDVYQDEHLQAAGIDFGYIVIGKLTSLMATWKAGETVEMWGPLGNGFPVTSARHLMLVAGGIGQTPFLAVAREALGLCRYGSPFRTVAKLPEKVSMCYGVRSAEYLAGLDQFELDGLNFRIATDDGTRGHHGLVTDLLLQEVAGENPPDSVFCCGPEPLMRAVAQITTNRDIPCWLSLESPMACGSGICFSCVTQVRLDEGSWDYRRTCVEGPVFPAHRLVL